MFLAARAALYNTRFPSISVQDLGSGKLEYDVEKDVEAMQTLDTTHVPVCITLHRVSTECT